MSSEDQTQSAAATEKTARTVGQLVKYSREVNNSDTVGEVGTYALEATYHVMDGHPAPTVFEVAGGEARVLESMSPDHATGESAGPIAEYVLDVCETVVVAREGATLCYESPDFSVVSPAALGGEAPDSAVTIATPSFQADETGEAGVILQVQWDAIEAIEPYHVKPVEYLADHVATAVANIRSRERLERARNDLARRKEMIEMYDRLLRHDLGNDLQIITGFSDALATMVTDADDQVVDYAEKIHRTSRDAADLIARVGDLVKTLEDGAEPEARPLEPILTAVLSAVDDKFDDLEIVYDPADFDVQVYAGDLLDSVFTNVVSNTVVHNDDPVTVEVYAVEPTPESFVVGVADDGDGLADAVRDDLFEIGRRGPDSEGTGFGLGIARALVESYGGTVAVGDADRGGADFQVTLERV